MDFDVIHLINPVKFPSFISGLDGKIFNWVNQFAGKNVCFDSAAIFFASYFQYVVVFCLLLFLFKNFKKYLKMVIPALAAAIFARFVIVEIIRYFLPRFRPFVGNNINLLVNQSPSEPSFPSGHAAFFFALATVIYFYNKKAGIMFFIFAFLISISRVFVGIHWSSDILVGAIIGIFSGWLVVKLTRKFIKNQ